MLKARQDLLQHPMNTRQAKLFTALIKEHIKTAKPIGSSLLVEKSDIDVSPATVRNDLMALENAGLLTHPHTSAGRVPTEKGYQYYVANFLPTREVAPAEATAISQPESQSSGDPAKHLAKTLAEFTQEAIVIGFSQYDFYYTGLSHFFQKPEFGSVDILHNMSQIIDHLDESIGKLFTMLKDDEIHILIGSANPVSARCTLIATRFTGVNQQTNVIGILGPMRMDYEHNISRLNLIKEHLSLKKPA